MTRTSARIVLVLFALFLVAGPVLAMPVAVSPASAVSAPHTAPLTGLRGVVVSLLGGGLAVFGITIRKDAGAIAAKFSTRAQAAAGDYKDGVAAAGSKWEAGAAGAESTYEAGVQQAIAQKRYGSGVTGKASKYQTNAVNLGSQRYSGGVANAKDAYARGIAPVLSALSSLSLPAKSFRGSPQNMQRANAVATALAALRTK